MNKHDQLNDKRSYAEYSVQVINVYAYLGQCLIDIQHGFIINLLKSSG